MRTPSWRVTAYGALVAVALLGLIAAGVRLLPPGSPPPRYSEGVRLRVPTQALFVTAVGYSSRTPLPWPRGNCFELSPLPLSRRVGDHDVPGFHVANMHHENFEAVVRRLDLNAVEVEQVGGCFLVVDPRIPRRWLLERPCSQRTPSPDAILAEHADKFRLAVRNWSAKLD